MRKNDDPANTLGLNTTKVAIFHALDNILSFCKHIIQTNELNPLLL